MVTLWCYTLRSSNVAEFLLGKPGAVIAYPTNKKLSNFLMKDRESTIEITSSINVQITQWELVNELLQTAVDLTPAEEITQQSKDLLASLLVGEKDIHPDALGGPYALLGDILFGENLDAAQRKHVKELKTLTKI